MITVTLKAAEKFKELIKEEGKNPETTALRVFVQGGGCSGFQYGMMFNEETSPTDQAFESNGVKVIVDPISISYIKDAIVDFIETDHHQGFIVNNPNATSTCGCGNSFSTD